MYSKSTTTPNCTMLIMHKPCTNPEKIAIEHWRSYNIMNSMPCICWFFHLGFLSNLTKLEVKNPEFKLRKLYLGDDRWRKARTLRAEHQAPGRSGKEGGRGRRRGRRVSSEIEPLTFCNWFTIVHRRSLRYWFQWQLRQRSFVNESKNLRNRWAAAVKNVLYRGLPSYFLARQRHKKWRETVNGKEHVFLFGRLRVMDLWLCLWLIFRDQFLN